MLLCKCATDLAGWMGVSELLNVRKRESPRMQRRSRRQHGSESFDWRENLPRSRCSSSFNRLSTCHRILWTFGGLSCPREVIGNVWKFLTSPKWRKINCGLKNPLVLIVAINQDFLWAAELFRHRASHKKAATSEIQFRGFISVLTDPFKLELKHK